MGTRKLYVSGCVLCLVLFLVLYGGSNIGEQAENTNTSHNTESEGRTDKTAFQIVKDMKIGWNLGNTLDSCDFKKRGINSSLKGTTPERYYETLWGSPVTTKKMIDMVADAGFGAVRVPVTYYDHLDDSFQIRKEWLDRVEEVVKYVLENNLYCIINLHHEEAWLKADKDNLDLYEKRLETVWSQIAERFKSYEEHLIFEGFNELLDKGKHWTGADDSSYETINQLNQRFVDTVRKSSGYNKERYLIVKTYGACVDKDALSKFQMPKDTIKGHLIAQIHTYDPQVFTWTEKEVKWAKVRENWNKDKDALEIDKILERLEARFISQGVPVIIGEFGAWNKRNTAERAKYAEYMVSSAKKYGITCFWWDTGGTFKSESDVIGSVLLNRSELTWYYPEIIDALIKSAK